MAVNKRGGSYQVDVKHNGKRIRISEPDYMTALRLEQEIRQALVTVGTWQAKARALSPHSTLEEAASFTIRTRWKTAPYVGADLRAKAMAAICEMGADMPLCDLTPERLQGLCIPARLLAPLRAVMQDAVNHGAIDQNPITFPEDHAQVRTLYNVPGYGQGFERLMLDYFLEKEEARRVYNMVVTMLDTGMTISEASSLTGENLQTPSILCVPGRSTRRLPLTKRAQYAVSGGFGTKGLLFDGLTRRIFYRWWDRMSYFFGLEDVPNFFPPCLRDTTAYRLYKKGVKAKTIKEYMGGRAALKRVIESVEV